MAKAPVLVETYADLFDNFSVDCVNSCCTTSQPELEQVQVLILHHMYLYLYLHLEYFTCNCTSIEYLYLYLKESTCTLLGPFPNNILPSSTDTLCTISSTQLLPKINTQLSAGSTYKKKIEPHLHPLFLNITLKGALF